MDMASMDARRFPVKATAIQGVKTNVVQCSYDDHIMIIVAQIGKMGTLLARKEGYGAAPTFNISILRASAMSHCARQLIEQMRFSLPKVTMAVFSNDIANPMGHFESQPQFSHGS